MVIGSFKSIYNEGTIDIKERFREFVNLVQELEEEGRRGILTEGRE